MVLFVSAALAAAPDVDPQGDDPWAGDPWAGDAWVRATTFEVPGLDPALLILAEQARDCARKAGEVRGGRDGRYLTIIDFRRPSSEPRLWVVDLREHTTLFTERVAHGAATGELMAESFSNVPDSHQSSLGLFRTAETYVGAHGRSLRLDGLEPGVNDNARARDIVIHGADYCTEAFVQEAGRLGRSLGCPALDPGAIQPVIDVIRGGTLVFAYYPDDSWLASSPYLHCEAR